MIRGAPSLHGRVALVLSAMLLVVWASLWFGARHEAGDAAKADIDARLQRVAMTVARASHGLLDRVDRQASPVIAPIEPPATALASADRAPAFALRDSQGHVLVQSADFPDGLPAAGSGYGDRRFDGQHWRVLSRPAMPDRDIIVQVALRATVTAARAEQIGGRLERGLLWLLPVIALLGLVSLWHGLAPLRRLRRALADIDPEQPSPTGWADVRLPRELAGLATVVDRLMARLARVQARQRLFAASAGHELRTPLAGCRAQVEAARRTRDGQRRGRALDRIDERIDHMDHLAAQLQNLARAAEQGVTTSRLTLAPLIRETVAARYAAADSAQQNLFVESLDEHAVIRGDSSLTQSLIDNLLRNALAATPAGGEVRLCAYQSDGVVVLEITDGGPGIAGDPARLFSPFARGDAGRISSTTAGAGLGLAIVGAVAEAQAAEVRFDQTHAQGHTVIVRWPAG
ncbi:HAMP domain-containing sensor histidine kinase [Salinisphaera sp. Q1T1-3]|uniref:sensor histidine kinase n=1 Tax=Salinisphaera sp. Q1T1-3 TaxID=2321229 RepID=UPI000E70F5CA|nr:HAMP domain-containing sensor histidine kinase [Salinisphaera sp. Q1T1-3]RJS94075.1 hypothetical protein D3260_05760 [Salinisphaera sp. Q1T1-3]